MQHVSPPLANGSSAIQYPQIARHISPQVSGSSFSPTPAGVNGLPLPPQASINPSPLSRRRSDYIDQSQEAVNGLANRTPIDYPELSSQHILRPPPIAASSTLDNRPRISNHFAQAQSGPRPPTIQSDYPVTYWSDTQIGTSGLKNLGNTCYMNSTIQCLSATVPFSRFFTDGRWKSAVNMVNPMGTKGNLALAFANILRDMWQGEGGTLSPVTFRVRIDESFASVSGLTSAVFSFVAIYLQPRSPVLGLRTARLAGVPELPAGRLARGSEPDPAEAQHRVDAGTGGRAREAAHADRQRAGVADLPDARRQPRRRLLPGAVSEPHGVPHVSPSGCSIPVWAGNGGC